MAESFLQRQISTYGSPTRRTRTATAPLATATPVMPNGQPQPAAPATTPQQPQQPAPAPAPVNTGQVDAQGAYTPGQVPTQTYQQQAIPQFQAPQFQGIQNQQQSMVQQLMNNPYTLSPQVLSQMKGTNRDQAVLMEKQMLGDMRGSLGARGIDPNSAYGQSLARGVMGDTNSAILSGNRALDIQAAQTNRNDLLQAMEAGNTFQNSALQRAIGGYGATLSGAQAQGNEQQRYLDSLYQQFGAGMQGNQLAVQSRLGAEGNRLQGQGLANDMTKFGQTYDLQNRQFDWSKTMDERNFGLASGAQSAANSQWEDQMAFQYQKYNNDIEMQLFDYLMNGGT
jgi:hypothetical protein